MESECDELPTEEWNIIVTATLGASISIIACSTNALILTAVYKKPSLHTVTNYFVAALALSDFFVGFIALPLWITRSLLRIADEEHPVSMWVDFIHILSIAVSTYCLCAVSVERYIGVFIRYVTTPSLQFLGLNASLLSFVLFPASSLVCVGSSKKTISG